jgi:hypothetical protein
MVPRDVGRRLGRSVRGNHDPCKRSCSRQRGPGYPRPAPSTRPGRWIRSTRLFQLIRPVRPGRLIRPIPWIRPVPWDPASPLDPTGPAGSAGPISVAGSGGPADSDIERDPAGLAVPVGSVDPSNPAGSADRAGPIPIDAAGSSLRSMADELRAMLDAEVLEQPRPLAGDTAARWAALASWGRHDLALARLAEGHTDAVEILREAGRDHDPSALYGVWAARSGGAGARLVRSGTGVRLCGTVRFCSGARILDRALVVADPPEHPERGRLLVDLPLHQPGITADPQTWATAAMADADTLDVRFDVAVPATAIVGDPGWYTTRPGFAVGGAGVAAVWWGGAAGVLDRIIGHLPAEPDAHQLAHLGELHAVLVAADALLVRAAGEFDTDPPVDHSRRVAEVRSAVERVAREVVDRAPRMVGPAPLSRDAGLARALADLALYVRQHHGERDHAALGGQVLRAARGGE